MSGAIPVIAVIDNESILKNLREKWGQEAQIQGETEDASKTQQPATVEVDSSRPGPKLNPQ